MILFRDSATSSENWLLQYKDRTIWCHGEGALAHRLHKNAVGVFGTVECIYLITTGSFNNKCIRLVVTDGPERFFRLL
jgi:hypothetical protein